MKRQRRRNDPGSSHDGSNGGNNDLIRVLQSMVECQQQQLKICSQVLVIARDVEQRLEKKDESQTPNMAVN